MAVMMTGGIGIRAGGLAPEQFIAVFFTRGLGLRFFWQGSYLAVIMAKRFLELKIKNKGE